jgi:hypothetical protein
MGSEFTEPPAVPASEMPRNRSGMGLMLAAGAAFMATIVALGGLVLMGAFDTPAATPRGDIVVAKPATPTPVPTLPPMVGATLEQLADPNINMHVSIRTTVSVNARVNGHSSSVIVNMEVDCAGGNEAGTDRNGGTTYEWRLVDGVYYLRRLPSGAWKAQGASPPFVTLSPLFMLREARQLQYVGPAEKNGVRAEKLESTAWWAPDTGKLSGVDVATLAISPQHTKLVLWVASDGAPVYATFRAWTDASDGTSLLDIQTTYTFTNQNAIQAIPSPTIK